MQNSDKSVDNGIFTGKELLKESSKDKKIKDKFCAFCRKEKKDTKWYDLDGEVLLCNHCATVRLPNFILQGVKESVGKDRQEGIEDDQYFKTVDGRVFKIVR